VWLFTIAEAGCNRLAKYVSAIGPLPVATGVAYTPQHMEAVFRPGMKSLVHRHSGPEAWYTLTGESCLETLAGTLVRRAGGRPVIFPGGTRWSSLRRGPMSAAPWFSSLRLHAARLKSCLRLEPEGSLQALIPHDCA
jgi:hypothetical protein